MCELAETSNIMSDSTPSPSAFTARAGFLYQERKLWLNRVPVEPECQAFKYSQVPIFNQLTLVNWSQTSLLLSFFSFHLSTTDPALFFTFYLLFSISIVSFGPQVCRAPPFWLINAITHVSWSVTVRVFVRSLLDPVGGVSGDRAWSTSEVLF